jgi:hypothetical protein
MVVHTCNPITRKTEAVDCEFKATLGYTVRSYLKKPHVHIYAYTYIDTHMDVCVHNPWMDN